MASTIAEVGDPNMQAGAPGVSWGCNSQLLASTINFVSENY
jgi:hypothetical protein